MSQSLNCAQYIVCPYTFCPASAFGITVLVDTLAKLAVTFGSTTLSVEHKHNISFAINAVHPQNLPQHPRQS